MSRISFLSLVMVGALAFWAAGCNNNRNSEEDTKKEAEKTNDAKFSGASEQDAQYMVDAAADGMLEVKMAERAKTKAVTQDVKNLADMMITAHTNLNNQMKTLAAQKNVTLPQDLNSSQMDEIEKLAKKDGRDFDEAYVDKLISMHKDAIDLFQKASEKASDPDIRNQFATALPELQKHLDMANSTNDRLKNMK